MGKRSSRERGAAQSQLCEHGLSPRHGSRERGAAQSQPIEHKDSCCPVLAGNTARPDRNRTARRLRSRKATANAGLWLTPWQSRKDLRAPRPQLHNFNRPRRPSQARRRCATSISVSPTPCALATAISRRRRNRRRTRSPAEGCNVEHAALTAKCQAARGVSSSQASTAPRPCPQAFRETPSRDFPRSRRPARRILPAPRCGRCAGGAALASRR